LIFNRASENFQWRTSQLSVISYQWVSYQLSDVSF
jgi:hypothetical protein